MADYSSLKVPELKKLLADRKLAQTGNKPDLIARLQEDDNKTEAPAAEAKPAENNEDEISYSDDEADAAPAAAPAAAASAVASAPDTTSEAAQKHTESTNEAVVDAAAAPPAPSFAMGLQSTGVDEETRRRAERAKRFGLEEDEDAKKLAERAKRFGIDEKSLASSLDSALPERPLKRGRGRGGDGNDGNRPGKRQSMDRRGGNRREGRGGGSRRGDSDTKKSSGILDDPVERAKAEKRAARFAAA